MISPCKSKQRRFRLVCHCIEIFNQCQEDNTDFKVSEIKGIVLDWSDTERKGLKLAIGEILLKDS